MQVNRKVPQAFCMLQTTALGTQQTGCPLFQDWTQALSETGRDVLQTGASQVCNDQEISRHSSLSPTLSSSSLGARTIQQTPLVQTNPVWCNGKRCPLCTFTSLLPHLVTRFRGDLRHCISVLHSLQQLLCGRTGQSLFRTSDEDWIPMALVVRVL